LDVEPGKGAAGKKEARGFQVIIYEDSMGKMWGGLQVEKISARKVGPSRSDTHRNGEKEQSSLNITPMEVKGKEGGQILGEKVSHQD